MKPAILTLAAIAIVAIGTSSAAVQVYDIDSDHGLDSERSVSEYKNEGLVLTNILVPDLRVTIAAEHEDVGADGYRADFPWHYVRLEYNETLPAEIRIYIPSGYFHPNPQDLTALEDEDVTAELRSVEGSEYSSLTVRLEGRSDVVFAIPRAASLTFATRDYGRDFVENRTDMKLPTVSSSDPWSYVDQSDLGSNTTIAVQRKADRRLTIQYDVGQNEERWINAPSCSTRPARGEPICTFTRDGDTQRIYVLSRTSDPPPIRYKYDAGPIVWVKNIGDSLGVTFTRATDWIGGLFGTVISV